jgi:acetyl esterase/lipase
MNRLRHCWFRAAWIGLVVCAGCASATPPSQTPDSSAPAQPTRYIYREVDGQSLKAYVFPPSVPSQAPAAAILLFHGGGWSAGSADWTFDRARRFARMGMVSISIEYRLSEGTITPIEALSDACHAFQWVRQNRRRLRVEAEKVAGYGVSAGGHLVAAAATLGCGTAEGQFANGGPDMLILWSPALDLSEDRWFGKLLQGRARPADYSPVNLVRAQAAPTSIVQGDADTLTPPSGARRFCEEVQATGARCDLNLYPGLGHLLTRNLQNQEGDYDPDPAARADGISKQEQFIQELWLR